MSQRTFRALLVLLALGGCAEPFTQPTCYYGPGCGEDLVKPVGEIIGPNQGTTVYGPFWLRVKATDNVGVLGVTYLLMGVPVDPKIDSELPYEILVNPGAADGPFPTPGARFLTVLVIDVAGNVDTLDLTVNYQF